VSGGHGDAFPPLASTPSQALLQPALRCGMLRPYAAAPVADYCSAAYRNN
jgi:hypothetical protein